MADVVNVSELRGYLTDLGWNVGLDELLKWSKAEGVPPKAILAYLRAIAKNRVGLDDAVVPGCPVGAGAKITAMLEEKGFVAS